MLGNFGRGFPRRGAWLRALALSTALTSVNPAGESPLPELPEMPLEMPAVSRPAEKPSSALPEFTHSQEITVTATRITRGDEAVDLSRENRVVTAVNRLVESDARSGSSFTVITNEDMENRLARNFAEAVRAVPGVIVSSDGGSGTNSKIMIRGAGSEETAVLLDGVRLNSPVISGGSGMFDLASVTPQNTSQITVLRGNNSVLYGSDALGGAVAWQLRKGQGKATGSVASEFGASGDNLLYRERVQSQGGNEHFNFSLAGVYQGTDGSRSAAVTADRPAEADGFWQEGFNSRFGITPAKNVELSLTTLYEFGHARTDYGANTDARSPFTENRTLFVRPKLWFSIMDGLLDNEFGFAYLDQQQYSYANEFAYPTSTHFDGRAYVGDWQATLKLPQYSTTVVGVNFRADTAETYGYEGEGAWRMPCADFAASSTHETDVFVQEQLRFFDNDRSVTNFGVRMANHETFGTYTTWHADSVFHLFETGTSFKVSGGSGFKAPTLYQLYCPETLWGHGNPGLKPETSLGWEAGVTQTLFGGRNATTATFFYNHYEDMIQWTSDPLTWVGTFSNVNNAVTKGVEVSNVTKLLTACEKWLNSVEFTANYTYLDARNYGHSPENAYGKQLARRPEHAFSGMLNWRLLDEKLNLNTELVYYGKCWDDAANTKEVADAFLWNMGGSYQISKHLRTYGKLNNLLRQNYCRADGYQSDGFGGFAGVEIGF